MLKCLHLTQRRFGTVKSLGTQVWVPCALYTAGWRRILRRACTQQTQPLSLPQQGQHMTRTPYTVPWHWRSAVPPLHHPIESDEREVREKWEMLRSVSTCRASAVSFHIVRSLVLVDSRKPGSPAPPATKERKMHNRNYRNISKNSKTNMHVRWLNASVQNQDEVQ